MEEWNNKAIERDKLLFPTPLLLLQTKMLTNCSNDFDPYEKYLSTCLQPWAISFILFDDASWMDLDSYNVYFAKDSGHKYSCETKN